jgi:GNAT superfamily N-acetyltransferase
LQAEESEPHVAVSEVALEVVLPLRHRVLRAGRPREAAHARQDGDPATRHFAALAGGEVVGVVTLFPEDTALAPGERAMRLRGMAVDPAWQGRGIGRKLMRALVDAARSHGVGVLWANGRDTALGFYEGAGFRVVGDGFVDGEMHLGHHVVIAALDEITS